MPQRRLTHWFVAASLATALLAVPVLAQAQQMVFLVRHAERADDGAAARGMQTQSDPMLSAIGQARALRLATMLSDAGVKAVFATEYRRTQDTGKPLATKLGLSVETVGARETDALLARLKSEHASDVVLIVGHSNTVPALIQALGGPSFTMAEDEYDSLFVVVPATGAFTRIRY